MTIKCYLSIGSNLGDREYYLNGAVRSLDKVEGISVSKVSKVYETEPYGFKEQPNFLNAVVEIQTSVTPRELLSIVQDIEKKYGREREVKWGPRTLDIDILLYGSYEVNQPDLIIPHPHMEKRAFVLVPLFDLAPELILPSGDHIRTAIDKLAKDLPGISEYKQK